MTPRRSRSQKGRERRASGRFDAEALFGSRASARRKVNSSTGAESQRTRPSRSEAAPLVGSRPAPVCRRTLLSPLLEWGQGGCAHRHQCSNATSAVLLPQVRQGLGGPPRRRRTPGGSHSAGRLEGYGASRSLSNLRSRATYAVRRRVRWMNTASAVEPARVRWTPSASNQSGRLAL